MIDALDVYNDIIKVMENAEDQHRYRTPPTPLALGKAKMELRRHEVEIGKKLVELGNLMIEQREDNK